MLSHNYTNHVKLSAFLVTIHIFIFWPNPSLDGVFIFTEMINYNEYMFSLVDVRRLCLDSIN